MNRFNYSLMAILSVSIALYAVVAYGLLPLGSLIHPEMRRSFEADYQWVYAHIFGSALALAIGPMQFSLRLRSSRPLLHRWLGRTYLLVGVLVGGLAGLVLAAHAFGGVPAKLGFGCLAVLWLYTGTRAFLAIRAGNVANHRRWMIRNFSLTFAAVTLRLWLPGSMALQFSFEQAYPVIAWLCWVPNLAFAELVLHRELDAVAASAPNSGSD